MRLVVLFNLVQGIESGLAQSTAKSPFPSPTPASSSSITAAGDLPRPLRPHPRLPGARRRRYSGEPLDPTPPPSGSARQSASPTPSRPVLFRSESPDRRSTASSTMAVLPGASALAWFKRLHTSIRPTADASAQLIRRLMGLDPDPPTQPVSQCAQLLSVSTFRPDPAQRYRSICFFPDRIAKWCCEIRQVLLLLFTGEPTPSPILLLHALLIYCYPYVAILLCHVSYPPVTYMSEIHLLALPFVCCLSALRVVGEFRVFVDISKCSGYLVGMLTHVLPFRK
nr:uncharacterized protein LOC127343146 [Lolium perenne]